VFARALSFFQECTSVGHLDPALVRGTGGRHDFL
jgi:hypothetical protein